MNRSARLAAAFAVVLMTPQVLPAQTFHRLGVVGSVEHARITEDEGYLGSGFGGAGGLQLHLTRATSVEVDIGAERHIRDLELFAVAYDAQGRAQPFPYTERWEGTATFVLGLVSRAFGSARVRPVIWGGGGLMSHGGTSRGPLAPPQIPPGFTRQPGELDARRGRSSRASAIDGGVGADIKVTVRVTVRPFFGLRLVDTDDVGPKYVIRSGVRIGLH